MKSLMTLMREVLADAGTWCRTSTTRDWETIARRVEHEGMSFLTITLPAFGRDFERALDQGAVSHDLFQGFSWTGGLPRFLGGFLGLVFDRRTGVLRSDADPSTIQAIRQITLLFAKILLPASQPRQEAALSQYLDTEAEVRRFSRDVAEEDLLRFSRGARTLFLPLLARVERDVWENYTIPRHGPGSTADRISGNQKFVPRTWHERLEPLFPMGEYVIPNWRYWKDLQGIELLAPEDEPPVKVVLVPKTLKTPRVIAMEPVCMMYTQQSLMNSLVGSIERDDILSNFLGFSDRVPNQDMAQEGSLLGNLATLDLSEASDRVANVLVERLFSSTPFLRDCVQACRSTRANVRGEVYDLAKFASMGSALTFPVEEMVFLTTVYLAMEAQAGHRLSLRQFYRAAVGRVRVYGDDIVVPVDLVPFVLEELDRYGFRVNRNKSFWKGSFRESCGGDFYAGEDVSIVRVRRKFPEARSDSEAIVSLFSLRNQFYWHGYWRVVAWLDSVLRKLAPAPYVLSTSPVLGLQSALGYESAHRFCDRLQVPLVKGLKVIPRTPSDPLEGIWALVKCLIHQGEDPLELGHLLRAGRSPVVDTKPVWAPPY